MTGSAGTSACIGLFEVSTALDHLLEEYKINPCPALDIPTVSQGTGQVVG